MTGRKFNLNFSWICFKFNWLLSDLCFVYLFEHDICITAQALLFNIKINVPFSDGKQKRHEWNLLFWFGVEILKCPPSWFHSVFRWLESYLWRSSNIWTRLSQGWWRLVGSKSARCPMCSNGLVYKSGIHSAMCFLVGFVECFFCETFTHLIKL